MTRTFDVEATWTLPALGRRVVPDGGRVELESTHESWDEYDTASSDLEGAGARLVRSGSTWTFTVDDEVSTFGGSGRLVPAEVRALLLGLRTGAALRVSRRVDRERTVHVVLDADGVRVGELADVLERVAVPGASATVTERRLVEVSSWDGPFGAAAAKRLTRSGAVPAVEVEPDPPATIGAALRVEIERQRRALLRGELALRRGEDAVHRTRVAIRRLRSVLRVVPVTEAQPRAALDAELRWLAAQLGAVRDAEVLRTHLDRALARTAGVPEATATVIDRALEDEHRAAQATLRRVLAGRRYLALLKALRAWSDDPPFTPAADRPVTRLVRYVHKAERTLERRVRRASDQAEFHRARKAAKRLRYTAEIVPGAERVARRAATLQDRLGRRQDAAVAADFLARIAATTSGPAAFGCGVLWAREQRRARR